jgi:hypothetical protein
MLCTLLFVYDLGRQTESFCRPKCVMYLSRIIRTYMTLDLRCQLENAA